MKEQLLEFNKITFMLVLLLPINYVYANNQLQVFVLQNRNADEIITILRPFVNAKGSIHGERNRIFVRTDKQNLDEIKKLIKEVDIRPRTLLITVTHHQDQKHKRSANRLSGTYDEFEDVKIALAKQKAKSTMQTQRNHTSSRRNLRIHQTQQKNRDATEQSVSVLEGHAAFIQLGQSVPFIERIGSANNELQHTTSYKEINRGFAVTAQLQGDFVVLEITPHQNRLNRGTAGIIEQEQASTTVRGRLGEWIAIGGGAISEKRNRRGLGYYAATHKNDTHTILVRVDEVYTH